MATRGRHNRDDSHKEFTGRVRRWTRVWVPAKEPKSKELKFQRWLQTDERPPELAGPRHTYIVPFKDPAAQPYPQHRMVVQQPPAQPANVPGAPGGMKRAKSQALDGPAGSHGVPHTSAAPSSQQQHAQQQHVQQQHAQQPLQQHTQQPGAPAPATAPAAAPQKFKLRFTLKQEPSSAAPSGSALAAAPTGASGAAGLPGAASSPPTVQQPAPREAVPSPPPGGSAAAPMQLDPQPPPPL